MIIIVHVWLASMVLTVTLTVISAFQNGGLCRDGINKCNCVGTNVVWAN